MGDPRDTQSNDRRSWRTGGEESRKVRYECSITQLSEFIISQSRDSSRLRCQHETWSSTEYLFCCWGVESPSTTGRIRPLGHICPCISQGPQCSHPAVLLILLWSFTATSHHASLRSCLECPVARYPRSVIVCQPHGITPFSQQRRILHGSRCEFR